MVPVPGLNPPPNGDAARRLETILVIGNGPSLSVVDRSALSGLTMIVINSAARWAANIAGPNDLLYFTDNSWSERFPAHIADWPGRVMTSNTQASKRLGCGWVDVTDLTLWAGLAQDDAQASSGHAAVLLALRAGWKRIILLGFDGGPVQGRTHWHQHYREADHQVYGARHLPAWARIQARCIASGTRLINASRDSHIRSIPIKDLAEALAC